MGRCSNYVAERSVLRQLLQVRLRRTASSTLARQTVLQSNDPETVPRQETDSVQADHPKVVPVDHDRHAAVGVGPSHHHAPLRERVDQLR